MPCPFPSSWAYRRCGHAHQSFLCTLSKSCPCNFKERLLFFLSSSSMILITFSSIHSRQLHLPENFRCINGYMNVKFNTEVPEQFVGTGLPAVIRIVLPPHSSALQKAAQLAYSAALQPCTELSSHSRTDDDNFSNMGLISSAISPINMPVEMGPMLQPLSTHQGAQPTSLGMP